jgi:hypothetical protein
VIDYLESLKQSAERVVKLEEDVAYTLKDVSKRFTAESSESDYKPHFATHAYCWMLDTQERNTAVLNSRHFAKALAEFAYLILPRMVELAKEEDKQYRARILEEAKALVNALGEK